jgi:hypothetical protein
MTDLATEQDLDRPIWGAEAIGREAGVFKGGEVDVRKSYHLLEAGFLPATKAGHQWTSTKRRLRRFFAGEADPSGWKPATPGSKNKSKAKRRAAS